MDPITKKILQANYVDSVHHTHVSLILPRGKFQLNRVVQEEFWKAYMDGLDNPDQKEMTRLYGIAEKPRGDYLPVLVDIDLKIRDDGEDIGDSLYTPDQLQTVIQTYQSVISSIVEDCTDRDLICFVLEKKMYQENKNDRVYFKNGFHLHFPFVFLPKIAQEVHLIPRVKEALKSACTFSGLGVEDSGSVVDDKCIKNYWLLYGSKKSETADPYLLSKVVSFEGKIISLEKALEGYVLFDHKEKPLEIVRPWSYYLPRVFSVLPANRSVKELKKGLVSPLKERLRKDQKSSNASVSYRETSTEENIKTAKKLMPLLSDFRAFDRNEWMDVGWTLFSISEGHQDALEIWCEFSSRCGEKYDENECIHLWANMVKKDKSIGSLKYYASRDNPEEYKKLRQEEVQKHVLASLEGSHNDVAKALYAEYGDEFVCASVAGKIWFQFKNNIWEQIEDGTFLREKISGSTVAKYTIAIKKLYDDLAQCENKAGNAMIQARIKQVNKMISSLKSAPYKNNVMKEASEVFYDPRFRDKLDSDPFLIAFKNGVYDLRVDAFRAGRPDDYLSKTMPIEYKVFTDDDMKVHEMRTFLQQVFPDRSIREYFLDTSSDVFVGGNHEKIVLFWTGEGDNGKSVTQLFFEKMLGKLAIKLNTNVITGKKPSAGSAFADLARAGGGVRWAVFEEPDADEMINTGIFKHLSGNDSFYARDLFERGKDGREICPMFKLAFICNKLPPIKSADKAVFNRARVLPFESTFCRPENPAPDTFEEQLAQKRFPMDKQFSKKIPELVEAFAWILLEHRKKIKKENRPRIEPEKVRSATELYKKQNDIYRQFVDENIMEDSGKSITLLEVYSIFKEWFKSSLPGHGLPVKNEVEEYFTKVWGYPEPGKRWKGYKQRTIQDDVEAGDVIILTEDDLVDYNGDGGGVITVEVAGKK